MKCGNCIFLAFGTFYIFAVATFFLRQCLYNQLIFSVVVRMYRIHVFHEAFLTKNVTFSGFQSNYCEGNKVLHQNHAAYQSNLSLTKKKSNR